MVTRSMNLRNQISKLTKNSLRAVIDNVYKDSLRSMLNEFSNIYYIDGNGNRVKVLCSYGSPERIAGRLKADNTIVLPYLSIVESGSSNDDERSRYQPMLLNEVSWDPKSLRATRVLSLSPRPITISYEVNIWAKYKADLDMLRSVIFSMFNPDLDIKTTNSSINKAFIETEREIGSFTAADTQDRILQKSITVALETYVVNPKFTVTNTGEISEFLFDTTVEGNTDREDIRSKL